MIDPLKKHDKKLEVIMRYVDVVLDILEFHDMVADEPSYVTYIKCKRRAIALVPHIEIKKPTKKNLVGPV